MKEIKFRAWDCHEMYYGVFCTGSREVYDPEPGIWRKVESVMQYTGLKDKNGKEIYESDIVKVTGPWDDAESNTANVVINFHPKGGYTIEWSNGFLGGDADITLIGWAMDEGYIFEVIGNIYENPELLKP